MSSKILTGTLFIVAALHKLLPPNRARYSHCGYLNVHPSLLQKFRGPSPVLSAMRRQARTIHGILMAAAMDAGPVVAGQSRDRAGRLAALVTELEHCSQPRVAILARALLPPRYLRRVEAVPRDDAQATCAKKLLMGTPLINLSPGAPINGEQFLKEIRAFDPKPRAHFFVDRNGKKKCIIIRKPAAAEHDTLVIEK